MDEESVGVSPARRAILPGGELTPVDEGFLLGYSSEHTRRSYSGDLRGWFSFCVETDLAPLAARRTHVDAWARSMEAGGAAARTVARRIASLSSFHRHLVEMGNLEFSPVEHVTRPAVDPNHSPTLGLDQNQGRALLAATRRYGTARDVALVGLLLTTGLRIDEALSRDVEDLRAERRHRSLRIWRNGGEERVVLPAPVAQAIKAYLAGRSDGPLFVTSTGGRYDRSSAFRMLRRKAHHAGIDIANQLSLRSLRRSAITAALDAGYPLRDVQAFAGHTDPRTTRRYDRQPPDSDGHAADAVAAWFAGEDKQADR